MNNKIKVNLSEQTYNILLKDIESFEFFKDNSRQLNKNSFFTQLIVNYYEIYQESQKHLLDYLNETISHSIKVDENKLSDLCNEIVGHLNKMTNSNKKERFNHTISIKPTKESIYAIDYIESYLLKGAALSEYFRNLFTSYTALPQDQREIIIFKRQHDTLQKAIKDKKKIFFTTKSGGRNMHESSPYAIANSKEELFNYLLTVYNNNTYTYRLSRIKNVIVLNESLIINNEQKDIFDKMINYGPQFGYGKNENEEVVVRLSNYGIQKFHSMYVHRPIPTKIENDLYYFNCSYGQIFQYFSRFGTSAHIISPKVLADEMKNFHKKSYDAYESKMI